MINALGLTPNEDTYASNYTVYDETLCLATDAVTKRREMNDVVREVKVAEARVEQNLAAHFTLDILVGELYGIEPDDKAFQQFKRDNNLVVVKWKRRNYVLNSSMPSQ